VVSELYLGPADPASVAAAIAGEDDSWQPITLDSTGGLRVERTAQPAPAEGVGAGSRHVDYVVPVTAFSTLGGGDPDDEIARLMTDLFDAIMSTFGWQWEDR
jgi:hypothetical protein